MRSICARTHSPTHPMGCKSSLSAARPRRAAHALRAHLVRREQLLSWRERDALGGHAVRAAQVAALGERDAQVCVPTPVLVEQHVREGCRLCSGWCRRASCAGAPSRGGVLLARLARGRGPAVAAAKGCSPRKKVTPCVLPTSAPARHATRARVQARTTPRRTAPTQKRAAAATVRKRARRAAARAALLRTFRRTAAWGARSTCQTSAQQVVAPEHGVRERGTGTGARERGRRAGGHLITRPFLSAVGSSCARCRRHGVFAWLDARADGRASRR